MQTLMRIKLRKRMSQSKSTRQSSTSKREKIVVMAVKKKAENKK